MQVVAGVIRREGRILICQRLPVGHHPLKWEFPGGKVEAHEDPMSALVRELREELDIEARVGKQMDAYPHTYSGRSPIELLFFEVESFDGAPRNLAFEQIRWEAPEKLAAYDFLEGDVRFVKLLSGQTVTASGNQAPARD